MMAARTARVAGRSRRRPPKSEDPGLAGTEVLKGQGRWDSPNRTAPTRADAIATVVGDVAALVRQRVGAIR